MKDENEHEKCCTLDGPEMTREEWEEVKKTIPKEVLEQWDREYIEIGERLKAQGKIKD